MTPNQMTTDSLRWIFKAIYDATAKDGLLLRKADFQHDEQGNLLAVNVTYDLPQDETEKPTQP